MGSLFSTEKRFFFGHFLLEPGGLVAHPFCNLPPEGLHMAVHPIENHGIIGDLHTIALVDMDACIDFMCFPHFDSPSIFAKLLDEERGGFFELAPLMESPKHRQLYLPDTNILLTRFLCEGAIAEVSDFMPVDHNGGFAHNLVRRAKCVHGEMNFRMVCSPAFDYGRASHRIEEDDCGVIFHSEGTDGLSLRLRSEVPVRIHNGAAVAEFTLQSGETAAFILEEAAGEMESACGRENYVSSSFKETVNFWHRWVAQSRYQGRWREMVNRSALTLKMLTSHPHGSLVAAPTFSLPEEIGGGRNWDYRYTWIRDASFTLYALIRLGYTSEAKRFMGWIEHRCEELEPDGQLRIMYGLDGRKELPEEELSHFSGFRNSHPVRIGNAAASHLQLDIYGELMDSIYLYDKYGEPISYDLWRNCIRLIDWVCENYNQPDESIWEVRGGRRHFLYSRVLCWVAVDRGVRLALKRSLPAPLDRWLKVRTEIYYDIFENFWNPDLKAFVQFKGADYMDAASLLMPLVKFIGPTDPRWISTLRAIESHLVEDSLVYRYRTGNSATDGLEGGEGTFSMCSFWYVECLSRAKETQKARFYFEKMLGYANHVGLYAEELGPSGEHLGNFPQAFTHLALISAAYHLDRSLSDPHRFESSM